jgi:L-rhamnose-H+ transport protein
MRYLKAFAWENTWFVWVFCGCFLFPPLIAYLSIPSLLDLYRETGLRLNVIMLAVGLVAGTSGIFYGLGLVRVGLAMANSLSNGVALIGGSFLPLILQHPEAMHGKVGSFLATGLGLSLGGVGVCALAASQTDQRSAYMNEEPQRSKTQFRIVLEGIVLCVAAGLLTPLMNWGLAFAGDFSIAARRHGASPAFESFALFVPYLGTSFVSNGIYCAMLWKKNGTFRQFATPQGLWFTFVAIIMAVIWMGGILFYGWAMPWMGSYGPIIAWPISLASTSIASAVAEYLYGDWTGKALRTLLYGLAMLIASVAAFAYCSLLIQVNTVTQS